jgi:hypothetical protein
MVIPLPVCILLGELISVSNTLLESIARFYSRFTLYFAIRLIIRSIILRVVFSLGTAVLFWLGIIPASAISIITVIFVVLYYIFRLRKLSETMSSSDVVVTFIIGCTIISGIYSIFSVIAAFLFLPEAWLPDLVFMSDNNDSSDGSSSSSDSSSDSSSNGSSHGGPDNGVDPNDVPDVGLRATCVHPSWTPYPMDLSDTPETMENCDMGGSHIDSDGRPVPHSLLNERGIVPLICNNCHVQCCYDCAAPEDYPEDYPEHYSVQAGPSTLPSEVANEPSEELVESEEDTNQSTEGSNSFPKSGEDYSGKGKGRGD